MRDPRPRCRLPFTLHFLQRGLLAAACLTTGLTAACTPPAASSGQTPPRPSSAFSSRAIPVIIRPARRFHTDNLAATESAPSPVSNAVTNPPRLLADSAARLSWLPAAAGPPAEPSPTAVAEAEAEIKAMVGDYLRAFNRHDSLRAAAHWSASADNTNLASGEITRGRDAVEEVLAALFEEEAGATIDIDVVSIRMVRSDVAVVDAVSALSFSDTGNFRPHPSRSRLLAVVVKQDGRWLLESVREAALAATPPAAGPLDALAWLVGSWEDAEDGVTASTHCCWSADRSFLIRTHHVTSDTSAAAVPPVESGIPQLLSPHPSGPREITEVIGWDPQAGEIRSWLFGSGGRLAEGEWKRKGEQWQIHLHGGGATAPSTCTCTLEPIGTEQIRLHCDRDELLEVLPPASVYRRVSRLGPLPAPLSE